MLESSGKVVVISGCDSGFGNGIAKELAKRGCIVFAGCYTNNGIKDFEGIHNITPLHLDITSKESVDEAYEKVKKQSPKGIWALINNAGVLDGFLLEFTSIETYRKVMEVNFFGHVQMTKKFLPLIKMTKGRIINMASLAGKITPPSMGAYCASKFAMVGWTDSIRLDLCKVGVKCILIAPEFFKTPLLLGGNEQYEQILKTCPKETLEEYGGEKFAKSTFSKMKMKSSTLAGDPKKVVDAYVNACLSRFPKNIYLVGLLALASPYLPQWLSDLVLKFLQ